MIAALPNADDAPPGLDLYVGDERRTTLTTNFGTATEALAAAVLRAGDPNQTVEGRVVLAARIGGEVFEVIDPPSTALRPGDALSLVRETVNEAELDADRLAAEIGQFFRPRHASPKPSKSSVWKRLEPSECVCEASLPKDNDTRGRLS